MLNTDCVIGEECIHFDPKEEYCKYWKAPIDEVIECDPRYFIENY